MAEQAQVGQAFGIMGRPLEAVLAQARDPEPAERMEALMLLAEHAPVEGRAALVAATRDPEAAIRRYARQVVVRADFVAAQGAGAEGFGQARARPDPLWTLRVTMWAHVGWWLFWGFAMVIQQLNGREGDLVSALAIPHRSPLWELAACAIAAAAARSVGTSRTLDAQVFQTLFALCAMITYPAGFFFGPWVLYRTWRPRG